MRSPSQGEQRYGRTTAVVTTSWQRTSRPMFPGRPGRWTERTQDAGSDRTYTHASRLRALSCVSGVGVRVSLGASRIPAIRRLSRSAQRTGRGEKRSGGHQIGIIRTQRRLRASRPTPPPCFRLASKRRGPAGPSTSARPRPPAAEARLGGQPHARPTLPRAARRAVRSVVRRAPSAGGCGRPA
jgi:hypothetical protein